MQLPHEEPIKFINSYQLVDELTVTAEYTIPHDHPVFKGHFPHFPVWPGVHLIEGMNQCAGLHALNTATVTAGTEVNLSEIITFVTSVDKVKFRQPCFPGNTLIYTAKLEKKRRDHVFYTCKVQVNNSVVASGYVGLTAKRL